MDTMRFNGPEYDPAHDNQRLSKQHARIRTLMLDGQWRTLPAIARLTGDPPASVSAQLRHLRKERFGSFIVERRPSGDRSRGLFEYRILTAAHLGLDALPLPRRKHCKTCSCHSGETE